MRLTREQADELIARLSSYGDIVCPICKHNQWNVNNLIIENREFQGGDLILGEGAIMPFVTLTCRECGNTMFLNALQLGFIRNDTNGNQPKSAGHAAESSDNR